MRLPAITIFTAPALLLRPRELADVDGLIRLF